VLPPPSPGGRRVANYEALAGVATANPGRFGFLGGGATLNPMIQQVRADDRVSPDLRTKLETTARAIVQAGGVGFGELAALHLSFVEHHPFEEIAPDHPAFLLLADLAAGHNVPLDLHMEAVPADMPIPDGFMQPPNPSRLRANIPGFERLLSHNPRTRIVWEHIGWDNTGQMTVTLLRRLLEAHPNLYLQIKIAPRWGVSQNRPIDDRGKIRPEWADLIRAFPDRFIIGSDTFYGGPPPVVDQYLTGVSTLLAQLPDDLARKIGIENAARLYTLK